MSSKIHVMVGVVKDVAGRVLIAQRTPGKHHAGGWEFPGGKLEPNEDRLTGLARELREELGIAIKSPQPLIRVTHDYSYGSVLLDVWVINKFDGTPAGLDGQALRWCPQKELGGADLLPADKPIVAALELPERLSEVATEAYVVEDVGSMMSHQGSAKLRGVMCPTGAEALTATRCGADFVVLRGHLPTSELIELCAAIDIPLFAADISLEAAWAAGATGLNLLNL